MFNLLAKELKELGKNKKIWLGILIVLIMIIIGTSYNRQNEKKPITDLLRLGVINHDDSAYSELLLGYFNASDTFSSLISVNIGDEEEVKGAFEAGELDIFLEIPEDFAMNMIQLEHSPIKITMNIADTTKAILFRNVLKSYEKYITAVEANAVGLYEIMERDGMDRKQIDRSNRIVSIDLIFTALGKEQFFSFKELDTFPSPSLKNYYFSSILIIVIMYLGLYVGFGVQREMKHGTLLRLYTSKTPVYQLLLIKLLLNTLLFSLPMGAVLIGIAEEAMTFSSVFYCLSMSMLCVSQAIWVSSLFSTTQRYILAGNLLIFFYAVIGGGIIPLQFLPQALLRLSKITPNYYMVKGILEIVQGDYSNTAAYSLVFLMISVMLLGVSVILIRRRSVISDEI